MKITIEGASEEFERKLLDLVAEHRHELTVTADTDWTVERAERYLRSLTAGARRFAEMVIVEGDGYIDADQLRRVIGKLNGPTVALSRAIPRGVRAGWWPEGTKAPINPVWDPDNPSWHKNIAYEMAEQDVPVFRAALTAVIGGQRGTSPAPLVRTDNTPTGLDVPPGWADTDDVPSALAEYNAALAPDYKNACEQDR